MARATDNVQDETRHMRRERKTIAAMIALHCHDRHHPPAGLCEDCRELLEYANGRLDHCVFGDDKPPCAQCPVHCYRTSMRARVTEAMRYAGPRMPRRHPFLALMHLVHGWQARAKKQTGVP